MLAEIACDLSRGDARPWRVSNMRTEADLPTPVAASGSLSIRYDHALSEPRAATPFPARGNALAHRRYVVLVGPDLSIRFVTVETSRSRLRS